MDIELSGKIDALTTIVAKMLEQSPNAARVRAVAATASLLNEQTHPDYRRGVELIALAVTNASKIEFHD